MNILTVGHVASKAMTTGVTLCKCAKSKVYLCTAGSETTFFLPANIKLHGSPSLLFGQETPRHLNENVFTPVKHRSQGKELFLSLSHTGSCPPPTLHGHYFLH
jgi:hypothetical protein